MSVLFITELANIGETLVGGRVVQAPAVPGLAEQHLAISGNTTASAPFNDKTSFVMLNTDVACSLAWSTDDTPTAAVTTAQRMGANETRFYVVTPGGTVSVIANS